MPVFLLWGHRAPKKSRILPTKEDCSDGQTDRQAGRQEERERERERDREREKEEERERLNSDCEAVALGLAMNFNIFLRRVLCWLGCAEFLYRHMAAGFHPFKDSGSKNPCLVWCLDPESFKGP